MKSLLIGCECSSRAAFSGRAGIVLMVVTVILSSGLPASTVRGDDVFDHYCWPLMPALDEGPQVPGEQPPIEERPSTWPDEGICTNFDGSDFERYATAADTRPGTPLPGLFPRMQTDDIAPSENDILAFVRKCEKDPPYAFSVRILNRIDEVDDSGDDPRVQMVVNYLNPEPGGHNDFGFGCYNIYFPPHFRVEGSPVPLPAQYPVVFQSNGWKSSNNNIFAGGSAAAGQGGMTDDVYYPTAVYAGYHRIDGHGFIYVQSNGGGDGSVGFAYPYLQDVFKLFTRLHDEYGANLNKVVTIGSSRGGGVALQVAVNPYDFNYRVCGVFSRCPPMGAGTMSQTPLANDPTLCGFYNTELYPQPADRYSHTPPPVSNPAPAFVPPMETNDPKEANDRSPDGRSIGNLRGKYIFLSHGTQDSWMPEKHWLGFERQLSMMGIKHTSQTLLNSGHNLNFRNTPSGVGNPWTDSFIEFMHALMNRLNFDPATFKPSLVSHGLGEQAREYWWRGNLHEPANFTDIVRLGDQDSLPFFATLPYRVGRAVRSATPSNEPFTIQLHGTRGRAFRVRIFSSLDPGHMAPLYDSDTDPTITGVFSSPSGLITYFFETVEIEFGFQWPTGFESADWLDYVIEYEDADGMMQDVSAYTNYEPVAGQRIEARTYIVDDQPEYLEYMPALWTSDDEDGAYMLGLGISWCEEWPADDIPVS